MHYADRLEERSHSELSRSCGTAEVEKRRGIRDKIGIAFVDPLDTRCWLIENERVVDDVRQPLGSLETTIVMPNNIFTGYEAARVAVACRFLYLRRTNQLYAPCWDVRRTVEGVLKTVGWRIRAETGVKPTGIGEPSM